MKQKDWAERLESHLKGYRKSPSRDLWEGIEASLEKQERQSRVVSIRRWMAAAVLLGALFGGGYLLWKPVSPTFVAESTQPSEMTSHPNEEELLAQDMLPAAKAPSAGEVRPLTNHLREPEAIQPSEEEILSSEKEPLSSEGTLPSEGTPSSEEAQTSQEISGDQPSSQDHPRQTTFPPTPPEPYQLQARQHQHIEMGLYASAGAGDFQNRNGVMMNPALQSQFAATRADQAYLVGYEERQNHDQPVSFGLSLSYPLTNRLSLSSGLVYTKLNSDFVTIMPTSQIHRHQSLHYMGIPLTLHFRLWQWRGLSAYLSAGAQADWNIKAKSNTDGVDQTMTKDRMQWSAGGSLGLQYNPLSQLGIYAEPGIRHYFDNGSTVSNFFKDKPTSFNLQIGLRVTLSKKHRPQ